MAGEPDPFRHHPGLRDRISDPMGSFFRNFRPADLDARMQARGMPPDWRRSDAEIEASRSAFLNGREGEDLWVFGYGSLMWDPAIRFAEVRHASLPGHARRFCLVDTLGARGTEEQPGLMAALDLGPGCEGLAFRIPAALLEQETAILWRREYIVPAYRPTLLRAATAQGEIEALAFVADHAAAMIRPGLTRAEQVRYVATGTGFLGSSLDYVANLADHFATLGIEDADLSDLLAAARALAASDRDGATAAAR